MTPAKRCSNFPLPDTKRVQGATTTTTTKGKKAPFVSRTAFLNRPSLSLKPTTPLKINPPQLFAPFPPSATSAETAVHCPELSVVSHDPCDAYTPLIPESNVWRRKDASFTSVIIKRHPSTAGNSLSSIRDLKHENVLPILEVFRHDGILTFVYQDLELSLDQILDGPAPRFTDREIGTVFRNVRCS